MRTSSTSVDTKFGELHFYALRQIASGIVLPMTSDGFLSTAFVVVILAFVALLAVASAVTLVPFDRVERRRGMAFLVCLSGIWVLAVLVIALIWRAI